jgi:YD repeat-containing protein
VLGRTLTNRATDGATTSYLYWKGYVSNVPYLNTTVTNPRGYDTTTQSDIWGRAVYVTPPTGPGVGYAYDAADRLITTARGGSTTQLSYDFGGRKTGMNDPDMGVWHYTYDALGNLLTQTDARNNGGCVTTIGYDLLNRLTGKTYSGNCGATTTAVTYTYDQGTNGIGRRIGMSDGSGGTGWAYDSRGRLVAETKTVNGTNGGTFRTEWGYNSADLVSWMKYPQNNANGTNGEVVNFTYLPQMLLDRVYSSTSTYVNNTDYDAAGQVDLRDLGLNGITPVMQVDYSYYLWTDVNGQGRLKQITSGISGSPTSLQVDQGMGFEAQAQGMPCDGDVDGAGDQLAGATAEQPLAIAHQQSDVLRRPVFGGTGAWTARWQVLVAAVFQRLVIALRHGIHPSVSRAHCTRSGDAQPSSLAQAA